MEGGATGTAITIRAGFICRKRTNGSPHTGPSGDTVIDENDGQSTHVQRRSPAPICLFAAFQFLFFCPCHSLDIQPRDSQAFNSIPVKNPNSSARNGSECQLLAAWNTEFAQDKNIQWGPEGPWLLRKQLERLRAALPIQLHRRGLHIVSTAAPTLGQLLFDSQRS